MKKSNFVALLLGTVSGILFSIGMCMTLLREWNAFKPGLILGIAGLILAVITVIVWRKMEKKPKIKVNGKTVGTIIFGVLGALVFGAGMCLVMVWNMMTVGIIVGIAGIVMLLCLIPICKGLK